MVWFVGLPHLQHSAALTFRNCTGIFGSPYIKGVAKLSIIYDAKTMNSAAAVEYN